MARKGFSEDAPPLFCAGNQLVHIVGIGKGLASVGGSDPEANEAVFLRVHPEGGRGNRCPVSGGDPFSRPSQVQHANVRSFGAGDMYIPILIIKTVNFRPVGGVEIAVFQGLDNGGIIQRFGFDHGKAAKGVTVGMVKGSKIVIVISGNGVDLSSPAEHILESSFIIVQTMERIAAVVVNFYSIITFIIASGRGGHVGPAVVVQGGKITHFPGGAKHMVNVLHRKGRV